MSAITKRAIGAFLFLLLSWSVQAKDSKDHFVDGGRGPINYYQVLELGPGATPAEIKQSYLRLVKNFHPDRFPNADEKKQAEVLMKDLNVAHDVLKDPVKKADYDKNMGNTAVSQAMALPRNTGLRLLNDVFRWHASAHKKAALEAGHRAIVTAPAQTAMFMGVMGLLNYATLDSAMLANPLALQQAVVDPITALGVASTVMMVSVHGYSEGVLRHHLPKFSSGAHGNVMVQSAGMTLGMAAMMYMGQVAMDKNVQLCGQMMFGSLKGNQYLPEQIREGDGAQKYKNFYKKTGFDPQTEDETPCDRAFDHLIVQEKLWEMSPQLASALTSALLTNYINSFVIKKAFSTAAGRTAVQSGAQALAWGLAFIPGGAYVGIAAKSLGPYFIGALNIAAFVALDHLINPYIVGPSVSAYRGARASVMSASLEKEFAILSSTGFVSENKDDLFDPACLQTLEKRKQKDKNVCLKANLALLNLAVDLNILRQTYLSKVFSMFDQWSAFSKRFTDLHQGSMSFYHFFINELSKQQARKEKGEAEHVYLSFDGKLATYGVTLPAEIMSSKSPANLFAENSVEFHQAQLKVVRLSAQKFRTENARELDRLPMRAMLDTILLMSSEEDSKVHEGLILLDMIAKAGSQPAGRRVSERLVQLTKQGLLAGDPNGYAIYDISRQKVLAMHFSDQLGGVNPLWEPGRLLLYTFRDLDSERARFNRMEEALKAPISLPWFNGFSQTNNGSAVTVGSFNAYDTSHIVDRLLVQMACGPSSETEAGDKVASWDENGWQLRFQPPSVTKNPKVLREKFCNGYLLRDPRNLHADLLEESGNKYSGIVSILKGEIRDDIKDPENFKKWWLSYVYPQTTEVYKKMSLRFERISEELRKNLNNQISGFSPENVQQWTNITGTAQSTVLENMEQELKLHLSLLGDLQSIHAGEKPVVAQQRNHTSFKQLKAVNTLSLLQKPTDWKNIEFQTKILARFKEVAARIKKAEKLAGSAEERLKKLNELYTSVDLDIDSQISRRFGLQPQAGTYEGRMEALKVRLTTKPDADHVGKKLSSEAKSIVQNSRDLIVSLFLEMKNLERIFVMSNLGQEKN